MVKPLPVRSVVDASRFTARSPYAASAATAACIRRLPSQAAFATSSSSASSTPSSSSSPSSSSNSSNSRFQSPAGSRAPASPKSSPARRAAVPGGPGGPGSAGANAAAAAAPLTGETPAQKVARLRAAHQAAKNAQVSQLDKMIGSARRAFDSAHHYTIISLIGFTAIAGLLTAYTTVDMMRYNSRRKKEFLAAQEQMEADSLVAARLAFMRGDATPEQTAMVEAARQQAAAAESTGGAGKGEGESIFKMPSLLGAPAPVADTKASEASKTNDTPSSSSHPAGGIRSWFSSTLTREEQGESTGSSQSRLGYESLSEEDDAEGVRESDVVRALEQKQKAAAAAYQAVTERAQQALEREKANQRAGGPLDRIGLEGKGEGENEAAPTPTPTAKKRWW
ncbi:hypothetical protein SEPCBS57363_001120 [Sporothrix epigloea]|uniref:Uncharacterized protein n=1 Tax=Sporothrix epigloea TaxID=1892477 RepID=A0ABP0D8T7_9PEZI